MQMNLFRAAMLGLTALSSLFVACSLQAQSVETVLYSFCSEGGSGCTDGEAPTAGLIQGTDGNFYGVTSEGGANQASASQDAGTIFKLTPSGVPTTLYSFCTFASCTDGSDPGSSLVQGTDGNFYGTTNQGGVYDMYAGTIFKITPAGALITLYSFCQEGTYSDCGDGAAPGGLILGKDGNFYGETAAGGANDRGTIFRITPSGILTTLYSFCNLSVSNPCTGEAAGSGGLTQGTDGNFYGTAVSGDQIYKMTPSGTVTILYTFCDPYYSDCPDLPYAALAQGSDGNLYGSTSYGGGTSTKGTAYKITTAGVLTTLYDYCSVGGTSCTDGYSASSFIQAKDGNFYGTMEAGGAYGKGTAFQLTPAGKLTTLYSFCAVGGTNCTDGSGPYAGVIQGTDNNFYGTTPAGGNTESGGTAFKLALAKSVASSTMLTASPNPVLQGQVVTFTATVTGSSGTPGGSVTFTLGSSSLGTVALNASGVATLQDSTTNINAGTYHLVAAYSGSSTYAKSSATVNLQIVRISSTTELTVSPNPVQAGQIITLTGTVSVASLSSNENPSGTVTFTTGGTTLGSAYINNSGVATLTGSTNGFPLGSYPVVATYSGDTYYAGSQSSAVSVTLQQAATTTTLTGAPNPVTPPASVTLVAAVRRSASDTSGVPTGTVTFDYGTLSLGTLSLNQSGEASITASTKGLPAGTYPITVKYSGDTYDASSTSTALSITVN